MKWTSAISTQPRLGGALAEVAAVLRRQLGDAQPDLAIAFVSAQHARAYDQVPELIAAAFPSALLIGCSGGGVIGGGQEIEHQPGIALMAAALPGVRLAPFHIDADAVPPADEPAPAWASRLGGVRPADEPSFIVLPDPFSFDAESFLHGLDQLYPECPKVGGLASGGAEPGANALFLQRSVYRAGLVGLALAGDIRVDTIVAQGCRPIAEPMFITRAQGNILLELDGEPAVDVLQRAYRQLPPADQQLAQQALFLGVVMADDRQQYRQGDFLIRNVIGIDAQRHALAIGAQLHENQVVQFHLRDAQTSAQDIEHLVARHAGEHSRPRGALLFSCLGRGVHLYGHAGHDSAVIQRHFGDLPVGGFFCNGEIGPVGRSTHLHGYTSALGLVRPRRQP